MTSTRTAGLLAAMLLIATAATSTGSSGATFTSTTSSGQSTIQAAADWTPPQLNLTHPGSPATGTVALEAVATDPEDSTVNISLDITPAETTEWSPLCAPAAAPVTCTWDTTTYANGPYHLRATATDSYGNRTDDTITHITVDNTTRDSATEPSPTPGLTTGPTTGSSHTREPTPEPDSTTAPARPTDDGLVSLATNE